MEIALPLTTVLDRIDYSEYEGELGVRRISGVATLEDAREGDASFVSSSKFLPQLERTKASLVILPKDVAATPRQGQLFLRSEKPSIEIAKLCEVIAQRMWSRPEPGAHRLAHIDPEAQVDPSATIGPFCRIEAGVRIGANCVLEGNVSVGRAASIGEGCWISSHVSVERDSVIGKRVRLHAGVVIGSDGFGYEFEEGRHRKVPQVGSVWIEDDVEIGANAAIDRGRFGPTRIGEGTKIDNLVQIGHNVKIGKHCILCAQTGIAGSTTIEDYVVFGGRAGASGHLTIGKGAQLAGQCIAFSDLEGGAKYGGMPAMPLVAYQRVAVLTRRLPDLFKRMKRIESHLLDD